MSQGHEGNGAVGTDRKKAGMTQRNLSGVSHQDIETHDNDNVDRNIIGDINEVILKQKRENRQKGHQNQNQNRTTPDEKSCTSS